MCQQGVQRIDRHFCPRCGMPRGRDLVCTHCSDRSYVIDGLRAYAIYAGPIRNAIHRLKYERDIGLSEILSRFLVELYNESEWEIDLVTPVPLGVVRKRERGYNQATLIAYPFALAVQLPFSNRALHRIKETASQVDLGYKQRLENVRDAFWAERQQVAGKAILVVDDVTTTGATINACAESLKNAGARAVFGFVVARTILLEGGRNDSAS